MKHVFIKPYYGVNVHSDAQGEFGVVEENSNRNIYPDTTLITAATIASKEPNINVKVIDANAEKLMPKQLLEVIDQENDCIFFKCSAPTIQADLKLLEEIKKKCSKSQLFVCGHIVKILKQWLQKHAPYIDHIIEQPIDKYIYKTLHHSSSEVTLDDFPSPDYNLVPYTKYVDANGKLRATLYTTRGCSMGCVYCPYRMFYSNTMEFRSIDHILQDIKALLSLGIREIMFRDQLFTVNRRNVIELCRRIKEENLVFEWVCETRIDLLDKELIDIMVDAGLKFICFGVESSARETLESFNRKKLDFEKTKQTVSYIKQKDVTTLAFYILGFPDETWESANNTYQLAKYINSTINKYSIYQPFDKLLDEESSKQITPENFLPFKNRMSFPGLEPNLNSEQLDFLSMYFELDYNVINNGLEEAFRYCYQNRKELNKRMEYLSKMENVLRL